MVHGGPGVTSATSRFALAPTDPDEAARATLAWARQHYEEAAGGGVAGPPR
jgi:hypothetical protein